MSPIELSGPLVLGIPGIQELAIIVMIGLLLFGVVYTVYNFLRGDGSGAR